MTTYYMRADGTAANKAAATGPETDASKCMNGSVHNAETFSAGDTLWLGNCGGVYRAALTLPSSGSSDSPITYTGTGVLTGADSVAGQEVPTRNVCLYVNNQNHIVIDGLTLQDGIDSQGRGLLDYRSTTSLTRAGLEIKNCTFQRGARTAIRIYVQGTLTGLSIHDNHIEDFQSSQACGVQLQSDQSGQPASVFIDPEIYGNTFKFVYQNIFRYVNGAKIHHNDFLEEVSGGEADVGILWGCSNFEIYNNLSRNRYGEFVWIGNAGKTAIIDGVDIWGNTIDNMTHNEVFLFKEGCKNIKTHENLVTKCYGAVFNIGKADTVDEGIEIYDNVVLDEAVDENINWANGSKFTLQRNKWDSQASFYDADASQTRTLVEQTYQELV